MYSNIMSDVVQSVSMIDNGFKPMKEEALNIKNNFESDEIFEIAMKLYDSKYRQVRMVAVFLFGYISCNEQRALDFLKNAVSQDEDWRVQEILGMSFDQYCKDRGYQESLDVIKKWLKSDNCNVRRAVSEGMRVWTGRPYFKDNPLMAIKLLSNLKDDNSEYVRKSVGNALRDISKKNPKLIKDEIALWDLSNQSTHQVYKLVIKNGLLDKK